MVDHDRGHLRAPLRPPVQAIGLPLKHRASLPFLLPVTLTAVLLGGCTSDDPEPAAPSPVPAPSPSPSPSPPLLPVAGVSTITAVDASQPDVLGFAPDPTADEVDLAPARQAVTAVIDALLESAQRGAPDLLTVRGVWTQEQAPAAADALRAGLATPDNSVAAATYDLTAYVDGPAVTLVTALVTVARVDGSSRTLELGFDVTDGTPRLLNVGTPGVS